MRGNNVLSIIFSNSQDESLPLLTANRTMGSVPFGSRYRLIDFTLSGMVNADISKVGIITKSNYQSLIDHISNGKPWDLSREKGGLYLLPPFGNSDTGQYKNKIEALNGIMKFINHSREEYVVLADCNLVCNLDYADLITFHAENAADITVAYKRGAVPKNITDAMIFNLGEDNRISEIVINPALEGELNYSANIFVMSAALLKRLIVDASSRNYNSFSGDILQRNEKNLKIMGYKINTYCSMVDSLMSYYDTSMELLKKDVRDQLFKSEYPIYTKLRDEMPTRYGLDSSISNSIVADGCVIEGNVENSVLFRGVSVGRGAVVKDSILMQDTYIGDNSTLDNVITDKSVTIKPETYLAGAKTYPIYFRKEAMV